MLRALKIVFSEINYIFLALLTALAIFSFATWMSNYGFLLHVLLSSDYDFFQKIKIPFLLYSSIATNFTFLTALYTVLLAALFGISLTMAVFLIKRKVDEVRGSGLAAGFFGVLAGVFGIGCAVCGSIILTSVLSIFGLSGALILLPLQGGEFGILGVILLAISIYYLAKQITNPAICKI